MNLNKLLPFLLLPLMVALILPSCQDAASDKKSLRPDFPKGPFRQLIVHPQRWNIGDTLEISFQAIYDTINWMPLSIEVFLPKPNPHVMEKRGFHLQWVPTSESISDGSPKLKIIDGFAHPTHVFEIEREFTFTIRQDNSGQYFFKRDPTVIVRDTIWYEEFMDE